MKTDSTLLWYSKPAKVWTQALPLGNGTLGAMVFGKTDKELIALNHDELWSGFPQDKSNKGSWVHFIKARELALAGKLNEAQELIEKKWLGTWTQAYMPLGNLTIDFGKNHKPADYCRKLDLTTAVASVEYTIDDTVYKRELFASFPAKAIAVKLTAVGEDKLSFCLKLNSDLKSEVTVQDGLLLMDGECPSEFNRDGNNRDIVYNDDAESRGIKFRSAVRVISDGSIAYNPTNITVSGARVATLYFTAETSFNGWQKQPFIQGKAYMEPCVGRINALGLTRSSNQRTSPIIKAILTESNLTLAATIKKMCQPTNA